MEVVVALTLWGLFAAFLTFPLLGLPEVMQRAVATLLAAEFVAFGIWHFGSEGCVERPCAAFAETGRTAASLDIPALAVLLLVLAVALGLRRHRLGRR
jgi:ABC-type branched-subunit amino acid transport system permease subunit